MANLIARAQGDKNNEVTRLGHHRVWTQVANWDTKIEVVLTDAGDYYISFENINSGRSPQLLKLLDGNLKDIKGTQEEIEAR